ncbi:hypothetical protein SAMN05428942_7278 [Streptomyces sp. 2112.2]|uniref:hypothetical protein n=1 Tax=Streptomyces sp. 2112.2 TaxID=1881024 RepID=UPI00089BE4E0|nr:hypothetical protein [Streptomyces sp. 2112.2]SEF16451.1 hypothetical protein SAMN05428942_7278 [Streptomyces sp. 2112.2]
MQLNLFPAYAGDLTRLHVGEQLARRNPAVHNGTLSELVCEGHRFPAECRPATDWVDGEWRQVRQPWVVQVGQRRIEGEYGTVVEAIREHVAQADPGVFERIARREAEMAPVHARVRAQVEACRAEVAALHERISEAHSRALDGLRRLDDAYADGLLAESAGEWIGLAGQVMGDVMRGYRRPSSTTEDFGARVGYLRSVARQVEQVQEEVTEAVRRCLLN